MKEHEKEQLAALGRIMANFSVLEQYALVVVMGLTGMETRAAEIVLSPISFKHRLGLIRSLTKDKYQEVPQQFADALKEVERAGEDRNKIVHSAWIEKGAESGHSIRIAYNPKTGRQPEEMSPDRLNGIAEKIGIAAERLLKAYVALLKSKGEIAGAPSIATDR